MVMQKPPCEPTAEISVCVNCMEEEEDKSEEGTESPVLKKYLQEEEEEGNYGPGINENKYVIPEEKTIDHGMGE